MDRKTLIICLAVLAVLILGTGVAVAFLYSGNTDDKTKTGGKVADEDRYLLLSAVPSDAVAVACFSRWEDAPVSATQTFGDLGPVMKSRAAVSMHYSGTLVPLYVFDAGKAAADPSEELVPAMDLLKSKGYFVEYLDCSSVVENGSKIAGHSLLLVSSSEPLVRSSERHLSRSLSIMSAAGFADASAAAEDDDVLFVSNSYAGNLLPAIFTRKYSAYSDFVSRFADWTVLDIRKSDKGLYLSGTCVSDSDAAEFVNVLRSSVPAQSSVAQVLPSYTLSLASLPIGGLDSYVDAYRMYLDSRHALQKNNVLQKELAGRLGVDPVQFMRDIKVREVAVASFAAGPKVEKVLLIRTGTDDLDVVFKGTDVKSLKQYVPAVHSWPYHSYASAVFGSLFSSGDESCFTWHDGWIIVGSMDVVSEYVEGRALEYTLEEYFEDASCAGLLSRGKSAFVSYFSFTADQGSLPSIFKDSFLKKWNAEISGSEFMPMVLTLGTGKKGFAVEASLTGHTLQKSKAPVFERDTVVVVPKGPFEVKNSGTGKTNRFYQNSHLSLCLSEDGKDLWGIPFKEPLCGTAHNIDYFANGKLQIVFGAGSSVYVIDRLGRYVKGFPLNLGKQILLGPDVYDFNGTRRYNIVVLHKDNTIEMYNMKGEKPTSWKGIKPSETVKSLPERLVLGGSTFWVVRTSIQTLIYPFYGGEAITSFAGDQMIRPDSQIKPLEGASVEVACYDGKVRAVKLK